MLYQAYGLSIRSEINLPELLPAADQNEGSATNVQIILDQVPKSGLKDARRLSEWLHISPNALWIDIDRVARFQITDGEVITVYPYPESDEDSIRLYLLGSAFGALLNQRGLFVLHGNAIRIGNQCMVCLGESGAGKSTLAAGFMQRGYSIISDDVVPVDDKHRAIPGYPRIKLWQDTADNLGIDTRNLQRIRPSDAKFNYPLLEGFQPTPLPIRWIYVLDIHDKETVTIEPLKGMQRFQPLYENTYRPEYTYGMQLQEWQLQKCGQLAGRVHLARINRPRRGFGLERLLSEILKDIEKNP